MNFAITRRLAGHTERSQRFASAIVPYLFVLPAAIFMIAFLLYPMLFNIDISFRDLTASNLLSGDARWVGFDNYKTIFGEPLFWKAVRQSLVFTFVSLVFQVGIGLALALYYNRPFPGNRIMRTLYLIGYAVPITVVGSIFKWLLDGDFGVINWALRSVGVLEGPTPWLEDPSRALGAVILINVWIGIPFNMLIILAGLRTLPNDIYEAASLDGAGPLARFRYITLPLLKPTILAVGILGTIFTFKMFDVVWITTRGGPVNSTEVLPTLAYNKVFEQFLFGPGAAILNVMFVVLFALSLLYLLSLRREERG